VVPGDWKLANVSAIYKGKGGSDIFCEKIFKTLRKGVFFFLQ
jgi:hypothetical protein